VGAVAASIVPATALGGRHAAPSDRLQVGVVGLGSRGFNLIDALLVQPDVQITAICDVTSKHYRDRPWGQGRAYGTEPAAARIASHAGRASQSARAAIPRIDTDFRVLCARDDIDVVVIATPDHWHALVSLEALRAGKDVYCEKPVTHTFREGQLVYREAARRHAVMQVGSQQRSMIEFQAAVKLVRDGVIGEVRRIEVGLPPGYDRPMGDATIRKPPAGLDYDRWTGPAPRLPYMRARHHRWWRGHRAYGGGVLMDWIGHHNDIAHWSLGADRSGPTRVEAVDWTDPHTDIYNTPHHYTIRCEYRGGVTSTISSRHQQGTKWIGDSGWIAVRRGKLVASNPAWLKSLPLDKRRDGTARHMRNFLDSVKSRTTTAAPPETAHRSITPGHLGYVSHALARPLQWDPASERIVDDEEADRLLRSVAYRKPWVLE